MTLRQYWELNIRGNAQGALQKLATGGDKASRAFHGTQQKIQNTFKAVDRGRQSITQLESRLRALQERQRQAWDPKHIARYNQMIDQTQRKINKLNTMGVRGGGMGGMRGGGMGNFAGGAMGATGMGMMMGGGGLALGAGVAAGMITAAAFDKIRKFDAESANLGAITQANPEELNSLKRTAIREAGTRPFTATEAVQGMTFLGMAGYNPDQVKAALPASMNLASAGRLGLDRSADIVSDINTQFGFGAEHSDETANLLAQTARTANTNIEQAYEAFKYLGPTAKALGLTMEETAAIVGVEAGGGLKGSLAGRALGTSLVGLADPTPKAKESMKAIGFKPFVDGELVPFKDILKQLEDGTKDLTAEQKQLHLSHIFGKEAIQELNIMLQKGSEEFGKYQEKLTGTTAAAEMARKQLDSLDGDLKLMASGWETLVLEVENGTGSIGKSIRSMIQGITGVLNDLAIQERFGLSHIYFSQSNMETADRLISEYKQKQQELSGLELLGRDEQKAKLEEMLGNRHNMFAGMNDMSDENRNAAMGMRKDIIEQMLTKLKPLQAGATTPPPTSPTTPTTPTSPTAEAGMETIHGGGRRVRNVTVNIAKMVDGGINISTTNISESAADIEQTLKELLIRAVAGGELALVQGE